MNAEQPMCADQLGGAFRALRDQLHSLSFTDRNNRRWPS